MVLFLIKIKLRIFTKTWKKSIGKSFTRKSILGSSFEMRKRARVNERGCERGTEDGSHWYLTQLPPLLLEGEAGREARHLRRGPLPPETRLQSTLFFSKFHCVFATFTFFSCSPHLHFPLIANFSWNHERECIPLSPPPPGAWNPVRSSWGAPVCLSCVRGIPRQYPRFRSFSKNNGFVFFEVEFREMTFCRKGFWEGCPQSKDYPDSVRLLLNVFFQAFVWYLFKFSPSLLFFKNRFKCFGFELRKQKPDPASSSHGFQSLEVATQKSFALPSFSFLRCAIWYTLKKCRKETHFFAGF